MTYLHPPQEVFVESWDDKKLILDGQIHFMFVGSSFFRKGGMEIIKAFQELRKYYNVKLTIVSSLQIDNYATKETLKDVECAKNLIQRNADWIDYYKNLPNDKVLELMKSAHIGLLPTFADTFGFSVLEFQASGCPVISTDVRALPEINNDSIGWLIKVNKNKFGEAIYTSKEFRKENSVLIVEGLKSIVAEIMENKQLVVTKSNAALNNLTTNFSFQKFGKQVEQIYIEALQ